MNKVLIVSAHADDETLGCGGTILKHLNNGDEVHWMLATNPSKLIGMSSSEIDSRKKQVDKVRAEYNFSSYCNLGLIAAEVFACNKFEVINNISKFMNNIRPNIVYLPFRDDIHSDHREVFDLVFSCTKSFRFPFLKEIYMMEILSETEFSANTTDNAFIPNTFVDVSQFLEKKIEIMNIYQNEVEYHPFPRSIRNIKALATFRGATAGVEYAESFVLIKSIK